MNGKIKREFRFVVNKVKGEADSNPAQLSKPFNKIGAMGYKATISTEEYNIL